jgi:hypothetical protein
MPARGIKAEAGTQKTGARKKAQVSLKAITVETQGKIKDNMPQHGNSLVSDRELCYFRSRNTSMTHSKSL